MKACPLRRVIISSLCCGEENQYGHHNRLANSQALGCFQSIIHEITPHLMSSQPCMLK